MTPMKIEAYSAIIEGRPNLKYRDRIPNYNPDPIAIMRILNNQESILVFTFDL